MRGNTTRPESFPLYLALNAHFLLYPYMYACMYTYMICAHIYILPCIIYIYLPKKVYKYIYIFIYEIYFEISENFLEKFFRYSRLRPNFFFVSFFETIASLYEVSYIYCSIAVVHSLLFILQRNIPHLQADPSGHLSFEVDAFHHRHRQNLWVK